MNNQEQVKQQPLFTEDETLTVQGFTDNEKAALLWLRQWYQSGGSDRASVVRHWEFLKLLVLNGTIGSKLDGYDWSSNRV